MASFSIVYVENRTEYRLMREETKIPGTQLATICSRTLIHYLNTINPNTLALTPSDQDVKTMAISMLFAKYSVLTRNFQQNIFQMIENGLVERLRKKFFSPVVKGAKQQEGTIGMKQLSGCFIILLMGHTIALMVFVIEVIIGYLKKSVEFSLKI